MFSENDKPATPPSSAVQGGKDTARTGGSSAFDLGPGGAAPLPNDVDALKKRLSETEKQLAQEKEKLLLTNLRAQQEQTFAAKAEASLKDIQQRAQREKREKDVDDERAQLRDKVKELETRLHTERETWVSVMKAHIQTPSEQKPAPAPKPEPRPTPAPEPAPRTQPHARLKPQNPFASRGGQPHGYFKSEGEQTPRQSPSYNPYTPFFASKGADDSVMRRLEEMEVRWEEERRRLEQSINEKENEISNLKRREERFGDLEGSLKRTASERDSLLGELGRMSGQRPKTHGYSEEMLRGGDFMRDLLEKERELIALRDAVEKLSRDNEDAAQAVAAKDGELSASNEEKARAIAELIKLKKALSRLQAVNTALERELMKAKNDMAAAAQKAEADFAAQKAETAKISAELNVLNDKYRTETGDLSGRLRDKTARAEALELELRKLEAAHAVRVSEMEALLRSETDKLVRREAEFLSAEKAMNEQIAARDNARLELEGKFSVLGGEYNNLQSGVRALQEERRKLAGYIMELVNHGRAVLKQKTEVEQLLRGMRLKLSESDAVNSLLKIKTAELERKTILLHDFSSKLKASAEMERQGKEALASELEALRAAAASQPENGYQGQEYAPQEGEQQYCAEPADGQQPPQPENGEGQGGVEPQR